MAHVLDAAPGAVRMRRAAFTDAEAARAVFPAFETRGFATFARIGPAPSYDAAPIAGTDLAKLSRRQLTKWRAAHVGYIFQLYNLVPVLTARENLEAVHRESHGLVPNEIIDVAEDDVDDREDGHGDHGPDDGCGRRLTRHVIASGRDPCEPCSP